ncbi:hypothetical protein SAY86_011765 [Trapa natans]|uniref:Zinc finger protein n=1 Tax=Trapa natans TaxID=22666 RepID=A0AAN7LJH2_TRANT|nr:hypothetical protein SAY86_011765 [Trapa natans]
MTGKAKPKKHTAKEIAAKVDAATTNRGGGKAGQADRSGIDKGGHAKYECPHCKITAPDVKSMQIHHDARHPKIPFDETKINNLHAGCAGDTSKPRPGVRVLGLAAVRCCGYILSYLWSGRSMGSLARGSNREIVRKIYGKGCWPMEGMVGDWAVEKEERAEEEVRAEAVE